MTLGLQRRSEGGALDPDRVLLDEGDLLLNLAPDAPACCRSSEVCAEDLPYCEPGDVPLCGCGGKGWEIITSDPTSSSPAVLGRLRRCESCGFFPDDESSCDAATAAGLLVDSQHNVLSEPWGRYAAAVRRQAQIDAVLWLLAGAGRLVGTCSPSIRFYALGSHVFSVKTTTIPDYSCEISQFEEAVAQGGVPGFRPASEEI